MMKYAHGLNQMLYKKVIAPLSIDDMDTDIISDTIYIFDYNNSSIKNIDLIKYILNTGINSDILFTNIPIKDKINLTEYYMNMPNFLHIPSINKNILNYIYYIKNLNINLSSDEIDFIHKNINLFNKWISFYDSYFIYMLFYATNKENIIKNYDKSQIINNNDLSLNIVSSFMDSFFYDYFKTHIDTNNIYYWQYYYNDKKYDSKSFNEIMLNNNNYFIKILKDLQNPLFHQYIKKIVLKNS